MPITEHQRLLRRDHLGSSDAPAIVGVSPWRTPADVYWSKKLEADREATEAMQTGNRLEPALVDYAAEQLGAKLRRNQYRVSKGGDNGVLVSNYDALLVEKAEAVEAKYFGPDRAKECGVEGTDEMPDDVIIQVQHQMYVGELERVWVAAALAGYRLEWRMYCVLRSDPLIKVLVERELAFWWDHVSKGVPPDDEPPPLELLKAMHREPGTVVELAGDAAAFCWDRRQTAAERRKACDEVYDRDTAELLQLLGDAEGGRLPDGRLLTYLGQRAAPRVDLKRLQREKPDVWKEYVTETSCRVLRMKEPKTRSE